MQELSALVPGIFDEVRLHAQPFGKGRRIVDVETGQRRAWPQVEGETDKGRLDGDADLAAAANVRETVEIAAARQMVREEDSAHRIGPLLEARRQFLDQLHRPARLADDTFVARGGLGHGHGNDAVIVLQLVDALVDGLEIAVEPVQFARQMVGDILQHVIGLGRGPGDAVLHLGEVDAAAGFLGALHGALCQLAHFARHHGKALALLAGMDRLDGRVQGQQVDRFGDALDLAQDLEGIAGLALDGLDHLFQLRPDVGNHGGHFGGQRLAEIAGDAPAGQHLLGRLFERRIHALAALGDLAQGQGLRVEDAGNAVLQAFQPFQASLNQARIECASLGRLLRIGQINPLLVPWRRLLQPDLSLRIVPDVKKMCTRLNRPGARS
jgi:hypothetical protein